MKIYISDHGSISTETVSFRNDSQYPSYVHQIPEWFKRTKTGLRLVTQNMIDALVLKYPQLEEMDNKDIKTGLLVGSGTSEWAGTGRTMTSAEPDYGTRIGFLQLITIQAGMVAKRFGINDYLATDATACASSLKCIQDASYLINAGVIDRVLILGWDDQISSCVLEVFNGLKASISRENYENGALPSAFDDVHGGFLIGAGIGFLMIESEKIVKDPVAEILGFSNRLHADFNPLSSKAEGYKRTMNESLEMAWGANLDNEEVHVIKSHGTGTKLNNESEKEAILDVCGTNNIVTSYKPLIGHTMGASGAIELDMLLNDFKGGKIRRILNNTTSSNQFISKDTKPRGNNFLVNASGMGGVYSSVVGKCII
jgi:3-oxoacyl-(acyl-carrier-protein) synthase